MTTQQPPAPETLKPVNDLDRWWDRHITARYKRLVREYPECFAAPRPATPGDRPGAGGEREARQKHMIGLWYEAGTLHSALRSAWVRHGHVGSPQEARLFRLQWRAYQRQERRGDAYDKAF